MNIRKFRTCQYRSRDMHTVFHTQRWFCERMHHCSRFGFRNYLCIHDSLFYFNKRRFYTVGFLPRLNDMHIHNIRILKSSHMALMAILRDNEEWQTPNGIPTFSQNAILQRLRDLMYTYPMNWPKWLLDSEVCVDISKSKNTLQYIFEYRLSSTVGTTVLFGNTQYSNRTDIGFLSLGLFH